MYLVVGPNVVASDDKTLTDSQRYMDMGDTDSCVYEQKTIGNYVYTTELP